LQSPVRFGHTIARNGRPRLLSDDNGCNLFREQGYTTTLLSNGKALLAGGYNYDLPVGTELYDFASGMWSSSGNMNTGRYGHTMRSR